MSDLTLAQVRTAVEDNFDDVLDEVLDDSLAAQLASAASPASFKIPSSQLRAATKAATSGLPLQWRAGALTGESSLARYASDGGSAGTVDADAVVAEADQEERQAAAEGIQGLLCSELREWFQDNLAQVKSWLDELGIKGALKKMAGVAKQLVVAGVTAIAGVVGSMFLAYALIALAVAAAAAAAYLVVRKGVPNYCTA